MRLPARLLLLVVLATSSLVACHAHALLHPQRPACVPRERDALLGFKRGITYDPVGLLDSWQEEADQDCCQWRGVRCSNRTSHVVKLQLRNVRNEDSALAGQISPTLLALEHLEHLDLSWNELIEGSSGRIPEFLGSLKNLKYLNLSGIPFVGMVPPQLGNLSRLQDLDLSFMNGTKSTDVSWLTRLLFLKCLVLSEVDLRTADWPHVLNMLPALRVLDLSDCSLATELFEILPYCELNKLQGLHLSGVNTGGVLPNLAIVDLSQNNISGPLPACMGQFASLRHLDLSHNHLTGRIPYQIGLLTNLTFLGLNNNSLDGVVTEEHFATLKSLQHIDLSYNSLRIMINSEWQPPFRLQFAGFAACQMGPMFPSWLRWLADVEQIDISSAGIIDSLPDWFSNVFSNTLVMNFSNNQLYGDLPINMEIMSLHHLYLRSNQLTGQIPPLPRNLVTLDISMNSLSGPLPSKFGLPELQELYLFSNHITGHIPRSMCKCKRLLILDLANNLFEGEVPMCFGDLEFPMLQLGNNSLSGEFPQFLQNYKLLLFLDLSRNNFSGRLPLWIGNIEGLKFLRLSHNMFSGNIPISMTNLECLQFLDVANNMISGSFPRHLLNLKRMRTNYSIDLLCNWDDIISREFFARDLSLYAVIKGQQRNYGTFGHIEYMNMTSIDLSSNNLSGDIPEDIATLDLLVNLNISWNHLSGKIPNKIGAMKSLESLDLSRNKLSGEIPKSLSNLTFLGYMDLSYNKLTGRIPSGSQLDTFSADMYAGNIGLCGAPLKNCLSTDAPGQRPSRRAENGLGPETFWLGLGLGFTVGLWVVFCTMLFNKTFRLSYFRLFDGLHDKAHVFVIVTWARLMRKRTSAN